ncbi:MAG: hypothetical protein JRJ27_12900 [Deltaproteobacteria bacterium]|nr:hypothetical protein [Deltaproteobacteria bacterium]MBW2364953.1 hypothetical protein [Deltaproteobacteria bacterium]
MSGRYYGVVKIIAFLELEPQLNVKNLTGQAKIRISQKSRSSDESGVFY